MQAKENVNSAFAITEIAERIFLELPPREILVSIQRTCRQFKAVVDGSKPLQQALFFEPITKTQLKRVFWTRWGIDEDDGLACVNNDSRSHCILAHPLLDKVINGDSTTEAYCRYAGASWRRQLAFQPPVKHILVIMDEFGIGEDELKADSVMQGIIVGQVAKMFTENVREYGGYIEGLDCWKQNAFQDMPAKRLLEEVNIGAEVSRAEEQFAWCGAMDHHHSYPQLEAELLEKWKAWRGAKGLMPVPT